MTKKKNQEREDASELFKLVEKENVDVKTLPIGTLSKDVFERRSQPEVRPSPFLYALTLTNLYC